MRCMLSEQISRQTSIPVVPTRLATCSRSCQRELEDERLMLHLVTFIAVAGGLEVYLDGGPCRQGLWRKVGSVDRVHFRKELHNRSVY